MVVTLAEDLSVKISRSKSETLKAGTNLVVRNRGKINYTCYYPGSKFCIKVPKNKCSLVEGIKHVKDITPILSPGSQNEEIIKSIKDVMELVCSNYLYSFDTRDTRLGFETTMRDTIIEHLPKECLPIKVDHSNRRIIVNFSMIDAFKSVSDDPFAFTSVLPYLDESIADKGFYGIYLDNGISKTRIFNVSFEKCTEVGTVGYKSQASCVSEYYQVVRSYLMGEENIVCQ